MDKNDSKESLGSKYNNDGQENAYGNGYADKYAENINFYKYGDHKWSTWTTNETKFIKLD